nr:helix-turn-helix domain-containing protein [Candidatus Sigynarchaeota archaeon]
MTSCVRIGIAASMLGVCTRTIRRWDATGKITCTRTPGGHRRISLAIIERQQPRETGLEEEGSLTSGRDTLASVQCG